MTSADQLKSDLDYVSSAVRRHELSLGVPVVHFMWAAIVLVGYALPDFAPRSTGAYWFFAGIGGGLLSWWLGNREARRSGVNDSDASSRMGLHWMFAGAAFLLCALPMMFGRVDIAGGAPYFMLVAGIVYGLAGVHLIRPLLWIGVALLAAYAMLIIANPPYAWTVTGLVIAIGLCWSGMLAIGQRRSSQ